MRRPSFNTQSPEDIQLEEQTPTASGATTPRSTSGLIASHPDQLQPALRKQMQARPPELPSQISEIVFILLCASTQLLFATFFGDVAILQTVLSVDLSIAEPQLPWIQGAYTLANGLAVIISGSLADLTRPRWMINGSLLWLVVWNLIGGVSLVKRLAILFFVTRAMQGAAIGVLVSTSISMLGRIYAPGRRKNIAFSAMASTAPLGFWVGAMQGGALASHSDWVFWSNAIVCASLCACSYYYLPDLKPSPIATTTSGGAPLSIKSFDFAGAGLALAGSGCLVFGLTEGTPSGWAPYSIIVTILGVLMLASLGYVERKVARPLIPASLWRTPGFAWLAASYALGIGSYLAWQFYALRFFLTIQQASPLTTALYVLPNAIVGVLAALLVSRVFHILPAHWLFVTSLVAFALGPVFFIPQTARTTYWALSMPGIALVTLGPDLSFAAASIFVTSQVPKSYQGSAGSLLVTLMNISAAVLTSVSDAIGAAVTKKGTGSLDGISAGVDLAGLRAIWWFNFATAIFGACLCAWRVRIPKSEEKEHMT